MSTFRPGSVTRGLLCLVGGSLLLILPRLASAQGVEAGTPATTDTGALEWAAVLGGLALLPFLLVMVSSFVKVAVVLAILKSAFGAQGLPPTQVIVGLAIILTLFIMWPVGEAMVEAGGDALLEATEQSGELTDWERLAVAGAAAAEPLRDFLGQHAHESDRALFAELDARRGRAGTAAAGELVVLVPAFVVSELKEAFQIGFLIFVPFLIIELVVANVLLSLGMHMLNPSSVALPFKLLLFVLVDGWVLLVEGLVTSYQMGAT